MGRIWWCVEMVIMWGYCLVWWFAMGDGKVVDYVWCKFVFEDEENDDK